MNSSETKPLETITRKIVDIRAQIEKDARQDAERAHLYKLASGAIRNILLHGIGSFNREQKTRTYILLNTEDAPAGFNRTSNYKELDEHRALYTLVEEDTDESMMFPQWAALIWARCRARMTRAALSLPYNEIIAIRTDAIATTHPVAAWNTNTKIGQLRQKWAVPKPLRAPASSEALDELQRKVTGK